MALGKIMDLRPRSRTNRSPRRSRTNWSDAGESDRVVMTVDPIENGAEYHFEIRDGILKAIGAGVKAKQAEAVGAGG